MPSKKTSRKKRGKLIVIDGTDGSGKATQTSLLARRIRKEGRSVTTISFPRYGNLSAAPIERHLTGVYDILDPYTSSVLYAIDRFNATPKINKDLEAGKIIVANRYTSANAGHQGTKIRTKKEREVFLAWLDFFEHEVLRIPRPNLTVVVHVPADVAQTLVDKKSKSARTYIKKGKRDIYEDDIKHLKEAERMYCNIVSAFPHTKFVECVEGSTLLSPGEIHERVWKAVKRAL